MSHAAITPEPGSAEGLELRDPADWRGHMAPKPPATLNAMTVDVEEYFQVGAFETCIDRAHWDGFESRVERQTHQILDLFAEHNVKATFFVLGWVAERHPALIRHIVAHGHELASHGQAHDRVTHFTPDQFRADLRRSRAALEEAGGVAVRGYRAPSFSVGRSNLWALSILAEEGYAYSSSIYPIAHDHYGMPEAPRDPFLPVAGSDLVELPVTTTTVAGRTVPCGGGGFFRLLPYPLYKAAIARANRRDARAAMFYFHPWEIDPEQPRIADAPLKSRFRHYTNQQRMLGKIAQLLEDFDWDRVDRVFGLA